MSRSMTQAVNAAAAGGRRGTGTKLQRTVVLYVLAGLLVQGNGSTGSEAPD